MLDNLIRNGTVVGPNRIVEADVGIRDGRIVAINSPGELDTEADRERDAAGMYVFPGFVDPHVHVNLQLGEFVTNDSISDLTLAAAHGGTTTVIPFAIPEREERPVAAFDRRLSEAENNAYIDYGFHGCLTNAEEVSLRDVSELIKRGAGSVKAFMVYGDRLRLSHGELRAVMKEIADKGGVFFIHAEDEEIIEYLVKRQAAVDEIDYNVHSETHPPVSETAAMVTVTNLVEETGCPTYFVHVSTKGARTILGTARDRNLPLLAETCPHYLTLTDNMYAREDGEKFVCSPPLRSADHNEALEMMLNDGTIQMVNSDHCCYDTGQKRQNRDYVTRMPNGLPGVETRAIVLYSKAVVEGQLSLQRFVELTSTNAARMLGLYPQKGTISIGADADLVLFDSEETWTLSADALHMETDYTPFEEFEIYGHPKTVFVRGEPVIDNNKVVGDSSHGQFIETGGTDIATTFEEVR